MEYNDVPYINGGNAETHTTDHTTASTSTIPGFAHRRSTRLSSSRNHITNSAEPRSVDQRQSLSPPDRSPQLPDLITSSPSSPKQPQPRQRNALRKSSLSVEEVERSWNDTNQQQTPIVTSSPPSTRVTNNLPPVEISSITDNSTDTPSPKSPRRRQQHNPSVSSPLRTDRTTIRLNPSNPIRKKPEKCDYFAAGFITIIIVFVLGAIINTYSDPNYPNANGIVPGRRILNPFPGDISREEYEASIRFEFIKHGTHCRLRVYHFPNGTNHSECIDDREPLLPIGHQLHNHLPITFGIERLPILKDEMRWIDMCSNKVTKSSPFLNIPFYIQCMKCMFPLQKYINHINLQSEITKHYANCWAMYQTHTYIRMYSTNYINVHMMHLIDTVYALNANITTTTDQSSSTPSFAINMKGAAGIDASQSTLVMTYYRNVSSISFHRRLYYVDTALSDFDCVHSLFLGKQHKSIGDLVANEL